MSPAPQPDASKDEAQAYEDVLARVRKLVVRVASSSRHHEVRNNAEDFAQDFTVFLKEAERYKSIRDWENLKPIALSWLFREAGNLIAKDKRHGGETNVSTGESPDVLVDTGLSPEGILIHTEARLRMQGARLRLRKAIAQLGKPCATVLRLKILEGMTPREMFPHLHYQTIQALYNAISNCVASLNAAAEFIRRDDGRARFI